MRQGLWEELGQKGRALMNEISAPIKQAERDPYLFDYMRTHQEVGSLQP